MADPISMRLRPPRRIVYDPFFGDDLERGPGFALALQLLTQCLNAWIQAIKILFSGDCVALAGLGKANCGILSQPKGLFSPSKTILVSPGFCANRRNQEIQTFHVE